MRIDLTLSGGQGMKIHHSIAWLIIAVVIYQITSLVVDNLYDRYYKQNNGTRYYETAK